MFDVIMMDPPCNYYNIYIAYKIYINTIYLLLLYFQGS